MEKQIKKTVKIALIFLGIGLLLGTLIVFAASPATTFYISGGVYPGAPSYTIWKEGSNYFAKDDNGQLKFSGTNATEIIQNCMDNLPATNRKVVLTGYFTLDGQVYLSDNLYLDLTQAYVKQGRLGTNYNCIFVSTAKKNIIIYGGQLDGNREGGTTRPAIYIESDGVNYSFNVTISSVEIHNVYGSAITLINASDCIVKNNYIWNIGDSTTHVGSGIAVDDYSVNNIITGNLIRDSNEHGIKEYPTCANNSITNNHIRDTYKTGISAGGKHTVVSFNTLENCGTGSYASIHTGNTALVKIIGNTIVDAVYYAIALYSNDLASGNSIENCGHGIIAQDNCSVSNNLIYSVTGTGIHITGNDTTVTSNVCRENSRGILLQDAEYTVVSSCILIDNTWGLQESGTSNYNLIVGLNTRSCTNGILTVGANTHVNLCWNITTWIS